MIIIRVWLLALTALAGDYVAIIHVVECQDKKAGVGIIFEERGRGWIELDGRPLAVFQRIQKDKDDFLLMATDEIGTDWRLRVSKAGEVSSESNHDGKSRKTFCKGEHRVTRSYR